MDYAKYSYLKLSELEQFGSTKLTNVASNAIEFTSGTLNMQVLNVADYEFGNVYIYGPSSLQCQAVLQSNMVGKVLLELLIDKVPVLVEERELPAGESQIILMKTYEPFNNAEHEVALRIKIVNDGFSCKLVKCMLAVWGSVYSSNNNKDMQMRALKFDDNLLVSYNQNNHIFMAQSNIVEKSFAPSDFSFIANGISHSFAADKNNTLYFFRVDTSGNLFYSKFGNLLDELRLDTGVSVVFARTCNESMPEDMLICYIKDGRAVYRCMTNGVIGSHTQFNLPKGNYIDIEVADTPDSQNMFVICTHENFSNYILYSINENDITEFVDSLNASIAVSCKKYVNLLLDKNSDSFTHSLNAQMLININRVRLNYEDLLNNKLCENLSAGFLSSTSLYTIVEDPEINYELSYSQLAEFAQGAYRVTYGADCADWQPATIDVYGTGTITDSYGILNKWPFNKIKPCLVHDGKNLGYLNPNDYSLFEDGSVADITNENYDVMVEFPKIYYKIEQDWDGVATWNKCTKADVKIYVSNKPKEGYVCYSHTRQGVEYDSIYIAAYENFVTRENKLLACSGVEAYCRYMHSQVLENFSTYRGSQYGTFHYHVTTMLQILSLLLFKEYAGGYTYGVGYSNSNSTFQLTGVNNTKGMFYGLFDSGTTCSKLFGLENIIGHRATVVDGLLSTNDNHYLIYDPTNPNCTLNYAGENYIEYSPKTATTLNKFLVRVSADTQYGFLPVCSITSEKYGAPYYNTHAETRKPSVYTSSASSANKPYMIYNYGGYYKSLYPSLFSYVAMYNINDVSYNAERLICYPLSKMS